MEWLSMTIDYGVIGLLALLSFITVGIAAERWLCFRQIRVGAYTSRKRLELVLGRNLGVIGTIASSAPYIGLLGTVFGIMLTFHTIGITENIDTTAIMVSLSLALKATAAGLVVAIIAVVLYNTLSRASRNILTEWDIHHEG